MDTIKPYPFIGQTRCDCSEHPPKQSTPFCPKGHWNTLGTTLTNHPMPQPAK